MLESVSFQYNTDSIFMYYKVKRNGYVCLIVYRGFIVCRTSEFLFDTHTH